MAQSSQKHRLGLATLNRRFPTLADLVAAVFRREINTRSDAAASPHHRHDPC